jgi:hypothetical protein
MSPPSSHNPPCRKRAHRLRSAPLHWALLSCRAPSLKWGCAARAEEEQGAGAAVVFDNRTQEQNTNNVRQQNLATCALTAGRLRAAQAVPHWQSPSPPAAWAAWPQPQAQKYSKAFCLSLVAHAAHRAHLSARAQAHAALLLVFLAPRKMATRAMFEGSNEVCVLQLSRRASWWHLQPGAPASRATGRPARSATSFSLSCWLVSPPLHCAQLSLALSSRPPLPSSCRAAACTRG